MKAEVRARVSVNLEIIIHQPFADNVSMEHIAITAKKEALAVIANKIATATGMGISVVSTPVVTAVIVTEKE